MSLVQSGTRVSISGDDSLSLRPPAWSSSISKVPCLDSTIIPKTIDLTQILHSLGPFTLGELQNTIVILHCSDEETPIRNLCG